jgi:hypothetical protein
MMARGAKKADRKSHQLSFTALADHVDRLRRAGDRGGHRPERTGSSH